MPVTVHIFGEVSYILREEHELHVDHRNEKLWRTEVITWWVNLYSSSNSAEVGKQRLQSARYRRKNKHTEFWWGRIFWTPAITKTKSNHFLFICISEKILCHFLAHTGYMKTGYTTDPYCVKGKVHRGGSTGIALLFLYLCTRLGLVVNNMPWLLYPLRNDPVPLV
jgi:hypothetical protein